MVSTALRTTVITEKYGTAASGMLKLYKEKRSSGTTPLDNNALYAQVTTFIWLKR